MQRTSAGVISGRSLSPSYKNFSVPKRPQNESIYIRVSMTVAERTRLFVESFLLNRIGKSDTPVSLKVLTSAAWKTFANGVTAFSFTVQAVRCEKREFSVPGAAREELRTYSGPRIQC